MKINKWRLFQFWLKEIDSVPSQQSGVLRKENVEKKAQATSSKSKFKKKMHTDFMLFL